MRERGRNMDFPAYVPEAVRAYITALLKGDNRLGAHGWMAALDDYGRRIAEIDRQIDESIRLGRKGRLSGLREERKEAVEGRRRLAEDVDCVRRLACDERMRDVYTLLAQEFDDRHWRNFIYAAWAARVDFAEYRDNRRRAAELSSEIARAAEDLAALLRQFSQTGFCGPWEFRSIEELLRRTDNHDGRNLYMWRSERHHILGDPPSRDASDKTDSAGRLSKDIRYAWGVAPELSMLLDTLSDAAREFKPEESGMIGAAIGSRKRNIKAEYLRAFGVLLIDVHGFRLTPPTMKAMAIVATVVINSPDIVATYDDVRKALKRLDGPEPGRFTP
jgi:hypothetical protein